jgi:hypothetical protein
MKKIMTIFLTLVFALTFAFSVFADQAAYISEKDAKRAVKLLKKKKQIKHFCEPCSDTEIETVEIETIEAVHTDTEDYWEVKINGQGVDLAYIYYEKKKDKWQNVAMKLKIEVSDVSEYLTGEMTE